MNFLEPLGLLGLTALVPIIALYFLKLKREQRVVPSTLLWKKVIDDMQVNSPFQRLKYSLLLLLQLLLISLLGFSLARPYLNFSGSAGSKTILMIDTSASMATKDAGRDGTLTRLEAAINDAERKVDDMRGSDEMLVVAFDREVRQLSKFTNDRGMLKSALAALKPRDLTTRANEAFETAIALCEGQQLVNVLVLSDGCFGNLKMLKEQDEIVKGNIEDNGATGSGGTAQDRLKMKLSNFRFVSYGAEASDNAGITQIDARTRPVKALANDGKRVDAMETQIFVMVENFSPQPKEVVLSLSAGTQSFSPKVVSLKGRAPRTESLNSTEPADGSTSESSRSVEVFKLPLGTSGVVTARITGPKDRFPADDVAACVVGETEGTKLLLVTKGNYFLEKALGAMKGVTITSMQPDEFAKLWDQKAQQAVEPFDACIFEGAAPLSWNEGGALFLGVIPPMPGFVNAEKPLEWPSVIDWDVSHPVMRYVNFGNVTVAKAQAWKIPKTTKVLVEGSGGPLAIATENDRLRVIGMSFDVFSSDWAYRPSLPLFFRNVVPWIAEASPRRHPTALHTGEPLMIPPGLGNGSAPLTFKKDPGDKGEDLGKIDLSSERSVFVKGTERVGLYVLKDAGPEERIYAVNLASREESDNTRRGTLKIGDVAIESNRAAVEAKREIWRDLAMAAGLLLLVEWWVFHRRVGL